MRLNGYVLGAALSTIATVTAPASALTINLIDTGGVTGSPAEQGFRIAADYWQSVLTNDVTMNITVGFSDLGPNVLGGTFTSLYTYVPIDLYYGLLDGNTNKSALDVQALAGLRPTDANGSVDVTVPGYFDSTTLEGVSATAPSRQAPTDTAISATIAIASANVKALINDATFGATDIDADIQFSSTFAFDFTPTNGIAPGYYDFIGVAVHEIGHAIGFLSGAEDFDYSVGGGYPVDDYWWGYAGDMFRYSADGKLDWTFGTPSYFSLDGGASAYNDGYWSTGSNYGDGWQASHWKEPATPCTNFRGIMNPYICSGLVDQAEGLDLAFLDAIGWNVNFDVLANPNYTFTSAQMFVQAGASVPEPASWALMITGFGLIGGTLRATRRKALATTA